MYNITLKYNITIILSILLLKYITYTIIIDVIILVYYINNINKY